MTEAFAATGTALDAVTDLLDLRPAGTAPEPGRVRLGVVAGRRGPRFLVPLDHLAATPRACLAYLGLRDTRTRLARGAVGLALQARLAPLVARDVCSADAGDGSLIGVLAEVLGEPDGGPALAVAVGLGRRDEVWKPTLQVFRRDGAPAAFVKVGLGPVAARLVTTEADTLRRWDAHPDPRLVVPGLVAAPRWRDRPVAVVAPLPTDSRRLPDAPSAWPVRTLDGPPRRGPVGGSTWLETRRAQVDGDDAARHLVDLVEDRHATTEATWARGHGDWVPWNLGRCHRGLVAWDWEYSEPDAPVGLDEVHGAYQQARVAEGRPIADSLGVARAAAEALAGRGASAATPAELRARAGTAVAPTATGSARWLADAHVAMLVGRNVELERLGGRVPGDRRELMAAADAAVARRP